MYVTIIDSVQRAAISTTIITVVSETSPTSFTSASMNSDAKDSLVILRSVDSTSL